MALYMAYRQMARLFGAIQICDFDCFAGMSRLAQGDAAKSREPLTSVVIVPIGPVTQCVVPQWHKYPKERSVLKGEQASKDAERSTLFASRLLHTSTVTLLDSATRSRHAYSDRDERT